MTCQECYKLLTDYQRGEVDAASDSAIFDHLQSCAGCRKELQAEVALTESLRAALSTERDLPMSVVAGVRQAVRREKTAGLVAALRALARPVVLAPTAAVILLAAGVVTYDQVHNAANAPQLSADYIVRQHVVHTMNAQSGDRAWNAYLLTSSSDDEANAAAP